MSQERAIEKIRKLLAVANNSATGNGIEHEQETAMRQALALLAKHNLDMKDVAQVDDKEDREIMEIAEEFPCPWRRVVAGAIANLYFCQFFWTQVPKKQKYKFSFVGLESNAITAMEMTKYLLKTIGKESLKRQKEQGQTVAFGTSFRNAAGARIATRCATIRHEAVQANLAEQQALQEQAAVEADQGLSTCTALALSNVYEDEEKANTDFIQNVMDIKLTTKKIKGETKSAAGFKQGVDYGNKVSLNNQIGTNRPNGLQLGMS